MSFEEYQVQMRMTVLEYLPPLSLFSFANLVLALGLGYVILIIFYNKEEDAAKNKNKKKYPPRTKLGLVGCIKMMTSNDYPWLLLEESRKLQSHIFQLNLARIFGVPMVAVIGKAQIGKKILMDPLTTKPRQIFGAMDDAFEGTASMVTSNGQYWHSRRKGMSPAFASKHVRRMDVVATQKVDEWIESRLSIFVRNDEAFNVGEEMINVVFDAFIETAFEYKASNKEKKEFFHDLEIILIEFVQKAPTNPFRKVFRRFIPERRRAHVAAHNMERFSLRIIDAYRQSKNPTKDTIIDRIMNNDAYKNDRQRAADITTVVVAGHDTTAFTISWILIELAKHPNEQKQLRESLRLLGREEWEQSDVLRKVVKEGMRLFPVAAGGQIRSLGRDFVTDDGLFLPNCSIVFIPNILVHRNSDVFEDADSFVPSRWDNPTKEMDEGYLPFGAGKQNCIGQSLANAEINSLLPRICSEFELELVDEGEIDYFLTLKPVNTMIKARKLS